MADIVFAGDAPEVAQIVTITVTLYDAATTYAVIMNGKTVSVVGSGGTTTTVATALTAALNASLIPEFAEVTWTSNAAVITGTADTKGKPFTCTTSETGGTGTIGDPSTTTTADGPNCVTALNFKNAATGVRGLPVDADVLYFQDSAVDLKYFLDAITGVTPAATYIRASYTGQIGLPATDTDGSTDYNEYRERFLLLDGSTILDIGRGDGNGSPRLQINLKAIQSAVTVWLTDDSDEDDYNALHIKGTHASNTLTVNGGSVDVAPLDDDTATFVTCLFSGDAEVRLSAATTHTTITATANSVVDFAAAATTLNINGEAEVTRIGSAALTTANVNSGTLNDWSSGTVTNMNVGPTGKAMAVNSPVAKTWTNTTVAGAFEIDDSNRKVTFSNAIDPGKGSVLDGTLKLGNGRTLAPGAP